MKDNIEVLRVDPKRNSNQFNYIDHENFNLKDSTINESTIGDIIEKDPSKIGLGECEIIRRERHQGNRVLDFLIQQEDEDIRYEVELQLGKADWSHICRSILYWSKERKKTPQYRHFPVLIAEEISQKHLELISYFNSPMIIIKMQGNIINNKDYILDFDILLDGRDSDPVSDECDDDKSSLTVDEEYWKKKGCPLTTDLLKKVFQIVTDINPNFEKNWKKHHIGLREINGSAKNFVSFKTRKEFLTLEIKMERDKKFDEMIEENDLDMFYKPEHKIYRYRIRSLKDFEENRNNIHYFIEAAYNRRMSKEQ